MVFKKCSLKFGSILKVMKQISKNANAKIENSNCINNKRYHEGKWIKM